MNSKYIKFGSVESGLITAQQKLLNFKIPSANYDMSESYINVYTQIDTTEATNPKAGSIYPVSLNVTDYNSESWYNLCLVKNFSISSDTKGPIENLRRNDILKQNLKDLELSRGDIEGLSYERCKNLLPTDTMLASGGWQSYFRSFNKLGTDMSQNLVAPIKIPLSDLCDVGKLKVMPQSIAQNLLIWMEMNVDKFTPQVHQSLIPATTACNDKTVAGLISFVDVTAPVYDLNNSPFYVGQKLIVHTAQANVTNVVVQIGGITRSNAGILSITFDTAVGDAGDTYTTIVLKPLAGNQLPTVAVQFNYAEVVLKELMGNVKSPSSITYRTYTTQEDNGNQLKNFQRMYQLNPECINFFMMFPRDVGSFVSNNYALKTCRAQVDGEDLWDREMTLQNGGDNIQGKVMLYKDRLNMTMVNAGLKLENLLLRNLSAQHSTTQGQQLEANYREQNPNINIICSPVNQTPGYKNLQMNIQAPSVTVRINNANAPQNDGVQNIILYQQVVRSIKV